MSHRLIVLPDDSAQPLIDALDAATQSINIRMFLFTDPAMVEAVKAAEARGVRVRVMLNPARRDGSAENEETRKSLEGTGVEVRDSSPKFALTHQKSMVIDSATGYVESLNWETRDLTETRDYAVVTTHALEVAEMLRCFEADWSQVPFKPDPASRLIWCPNNGRARIAEFIDSARQTLWLQNERYQDTVIIERLVRAIERGVKVHIMARPPHNLKKGKLIEGVGGLRIMRDVGAKVHRLKKLKLHGKMLLADEAARHHRVDQSGTGQLRRASGAGHRNRCPPCHRSVERGHAAGLGALRSARFERRGRAGRPGQAPSRAFRRQEAGADHAWQDEAQVAARRRPPPGATSPAGPAHHWRRPWPRRSARAA